MDGKSEKLKTPPFLEETGPALLASSSDDGAPLHDPEFEQTGSAEKNPFEALPPVANQRIKQIWAVGGGKGGVGKSLVASSLAIALARQGNRVTAIDLDLGGANLHTTLGIELPKQTLSDFFSQNENSLENFLTPTGIPYLQLISGAQDAVGVVNVGFEQKVRLLQKIRELNTDYVVIDLGAGTTVNTMDFFLFADIGLLAVLPEPTSIENAYRFIKSAYYRRLFHSPALKEVRPLVEMAMDPKNAMNIRSPSDLFREVNRMSPETGMALKREIEKFRPKLIINQARTQSDVDIGMSIKTICRKYFGIEMDYVGFLDYDSAVWQAVRRKRPFMLEFPNSKLVSSIERMVNYITKRCANHKNELL